MRHINLYWFNRIPNIGDYASYFVVSELCVGKVVHRLPNFPILSWLKGKIKRKRTPLIKDFLLPFQKCLFAIGSILDFSNNNVVVWGSGFRSYNSYFKGGDIYAVRGELSKSKLPVFRDSRDIAIGDPALLLPLIIDGKYCELYHDVEPNSQSRLKIVAHYRDYDDMTSRFGNDFDFVNIMTEDICGFVKTIRSADFVLSTSLHGVIISHAFGIPALWIYNKSIRTDSFKFHDYFSSVGIPMYEGFTNIDTLLFEGKWKELFANNKDKMLPNVDLLGIAKGLLKKAPFEIKDEYNSFVH